MEISEPYGRVQPKRSYDTVPLQIDWHDYLIDLWQPGMSVALGARTRPLRTEATGLEYEVTTIGITGHGKPNWPINEGNMVQDGSAVWTARAVTSLSLRTQIANQSWELPDGITLIGSATDDYVYTAFIAGGIDGSDYVIKHQVELTNGERKEGVAVLPVRD